MWRRLLMILALVALAVAGGVFVLTRPFVAEAVRTRIIALAHERLGLTVSIARLAVELTPPGVVLEEVSVQRPGENEPWLRMHSAYLAVQPWPSAAGALVIRRLVLDGLIAEVPIEQLTRMAADSAAGSRPTVDVHELTLWNASLRARDPTGTATLERVDLRIKLAPRGGRFVELQVGSGEWSGEGRTLAFEAEGRGHLSGTLDHPVAIEMERADLYLPGIALRASGRAALAASRALALGVEASGRIERLRDLLPQVPDLGGEAIVHATINGTLAKPELELAGEVKSLRYAALELGELQAAAKLTAERLSVESFRLENPRAGTVTGSGTLDLDEAAHLAVTARARRASLPAILDYAGLADAWVELLYTGDVTLRGSLEPVELELDTSGMIEHFAALDRSYRQPGPARMIELDDVALRAQATITAERLRLVNAEVERGETWLNVAGQFLFDTDAGFRLQVDGQAIDMADVGPIASVPFSGRGMLEATIEGPYGVPRIVGTTELDEFGVSGYTLGTAAGRLVFDDLALRLEQVTITRGRGTASVSGAFDFGGAEPRVQGSVKIEGVELGDVLADLRLGTSATQRLGAQLSGTVSLAGPLVMPAGELSLSAPQLLVDSVDLGPLSVHGGFGAGHGKLAGDVVLEPKEGRLTGHLAWRENGDLAIGAELSHFPLPQLGTLAGAAMGGAVSGSLEVAGQPAQLSGSAQVTASALSVEGVRLGQVALLASLASGRLAVRGTLLDGTAPAQAEIRLERGLPFAATVSLDQIELQRAVDLAGIAVVMTGTLFAQGDLAQPGASMTDAEITQARVGLNKLLLTTDRPVRLQYTHGHFELADLHLVGEGVELSAVGGGTLAGPVRGQVSVRGDLGALVALMPGVETARGGFGLSAEILGTSQAPSWQGQGFVHSGSLRLAGSEQAIDHIEAQLVLSERSVTMQQASANVGGGSVRLGGQAVLPVDGRGEIDLHAELGSVSWRPIRDMVTTFSGNLSLAGPTDDLTLKGRIKLEALRYTANVSVNFEDLIPRAHPPPLRVGGLEPGKAIALAVSVYAPNNVIVSNNLVEAELRADLMVTGTTERVGLIGSLTPLWARARYRDNVLTVERATIDFSDEYRIFTSFDIRATTQACGMRLAVDVQGSSDDWKFAPSGEDERGAVDPRDALTCLQFGRRLRDFEGHEAAGLGTTLRDTLPGGLDTLWTVSGLDAKVKNLLPIQLDEVRLTSGWTSRTTRTTPRVTPRVLVAKELGSDMRLTYSRSLEEVSDQTVSMQYRLSNRATLDGSWLSVSDVPIGDLGVDLRLRWEFP